MPVATPLLHTLETPRHPPACATVSAEAMPAQGMGAPRMVRLSGLGALARLTRAACAHLVLAAGLCAAAQAATINDQLTACSACHGPQGEGNVTLGAPALAGQRAEYLERQLNAFRTGQRAYHPADVHGATMRAAVKGLSAADSAALARHFATLPRPPRAAPAVAGARVSDGKAHYEAQCAHCHGYQAEGYAQLQTPALRGLHPDYLRAQLDAYTRGWRGKAPGGGDVPAQWMRSIAPQVSDAQALEQILRYLSGV